MGNFKFLGREFDNAFAKIEVTIVVASAVVTDDTFIVFETGGVGFSVPKSKLGRKPRKGSTLTLCVARDSIPEQIQAGLVVPVTEMPQVTVTASDGLSRSDAR
jgi:hypothetical protein